MLTEYFFSAESELGMRSSFGVLVDAALGGWSSSSDRERAIVRRHRLGPNAETSVSKARMVRSLLLAVGSEHETVLDAWFGMHDWQHLLDDVFGKGAGTKVTMALGELVGVALLTEPLRRGFERDREKKRATTEVPSTRYVRPTIVRVVKADDDGWPEEHFEVRDPEWAARRLDTIGAYLFALCGKTGDKQLDTVHAAASQLARGAVSAFADAAGVEPFMTSEPRPRGVRMSRVARHVDPIRAWVDK
jgi:hypothetical protein